jgi:hypothetical protein
VCEWPVVDSILASLLTHPDCFYLQIDRDSVEEVPVRFYLQIDRDSVEEVPVRME